MSLFLRKFAWLIASATLFPPITPGQARTELQDLRNYYHTAWSDVGAVFDVKRTPEGYLWLTTSRGVLRFDGIRFESIGEVTHGAVSTSEIDSVFLSPSGGLWLTTQGAGLLFWKDESLSKFPDRRCTPARKQGQVIEDGDGSLWVQATAGLFRLKGKACEQIGDEQGYAGGFAAGMLLDSDGTLWVKARSGPLQFLPKGHTRFETSEHGAGISPNYAYLRESTNGAIWLSDSQGLRQVACKRSAPAGCGPAESYTGKDHYGDFMFTGGSSMWAVTGRGVERFPRVADWTKPIAVEGAASDRFTPSEGLSSDAVWRVLVDADGAWVATNSGLDRLRRATLTPVRLPHVQEHEFSIAAGDDGSIWTGNAGLPLTLISAEGVLTSFPRTKQTTALRRDHNGTIWSAGAGQSYLWRAKGKELIPLHYPDEKLDPVVFVATDRNNEPWITTLSGRAYHLSGGTWSNETPVLGKKPGVLGAMTDDAEGNVWFAFSNYVVKWDGTRYTPYSFPDGQRGVSENTMSVRDAHVWLGGAGGIQLFTQGRFYLMRWQDPELPGRVSGVVETSPGDLWVNGFSGITHVAAAELQKWLKDPAWLVSGERLSDLDGLPGLSGEVLPEPSLVEARDGRLWFATTKGIAWLDPARLERNRHRKPSLVVISALTANGKTVGATNGLTLPPRTENLEIAYTALGLAIPERARFRYKLDGIHQDWQDAGTRRQVYFSNLGPGDYKFRVAANNGEGDSSEADGTLNFRITPTFYQTSWFMAFCVAAAFTGLYLLYLMRLKQVAQLVRERLEGRLAERERIARELHDTLLQGVQGLILKFHAAAKQMPPDGAARESMENALELADRVMDEGRERIRDLRYQTESLTDLPQALRQIADEARRGDTQFSAVVEGTARELHPMVLEQIYLIAREALLNALNHSTGQHVEAEITYDAQRFRLRIRDDGRGMDPTILARGRGGHWGLQGMRERAQKIGGHLEIWSRPGSGTEMELRVPAATAYKSQTAERKSFGFGRGSTADS